MVFDEDDQNPYVLFFGEKSTSKTSAEQGVSIGTTSSSIISFILAFTSSVTSDAMASLEGLRLLQRITYWAFRSWAFVARKNENQGQHNYYNKIRRRSDRYDDDDIIIILLMKKVVYYKLIISISMKKTDNNNNITTNIIIILLYDD